MQAIRIYVLKYKLTTTTRRRKFQRKINVAMDGLYEKINYFRSLRSKPNDKFAAKGALSTIEY